MQLEMSMPNRAGILTPIDGLDEGETVTMLVMPEGSEVELFWGGFEFIILILYCNKLHLQT